MRVAAIDCGTNTVRLFVAGPDAPAVREVTITRLGAGVDAAGRLAPEAMSRTVAAIATYVEQARAVGAERIAIVGTSAARDAANARDFVHAVVEATGVTPAIVDGETEARLSFAGAASILADERPRVVADIGGGSTELVLGDDAPRRWVSLQLGSVRLAERHGLTGIVSQSELAEVDRVVDRQLAAAVSGWPLEEAGLVGVAATVTSLAAIDAGLASYDPAVVHGRELTRDAVAGIRSSLAATPPADRLVRWPILQPGREDVIVAGATILLAILRVLDLPALLACETDILDGIAAELLAGREIPSTV